MRKSSARPRQFLNRRGAKRLALLVPLLALVAGCVSARRDAAEPALSVRLVRFSAWAADGAARDGAGSLSAAAIDLAGFAPTNACEATFAVAAAGGAIVTGFAEGSFELLSARAPGGRDLLSGTSEGGRAWSCEAEPPDRFRIRLSPLDAPLFSAPELHGRFVALVAPSNVEERAVLAPRPGEKAQFGRCTVRVKKAESPGVLFSALGAAPSKKDLALEISARDGDDGVVALEADGREILRSEPELSDLAADFTSRIEAEADSVAGVKTRSKSVRVYSSSPVGSFRADAGKTVRIVNFKKPAADEMTVVFVHPADPARVPAEF